MGTIDELAKPPEYAQAKAFQRELTTRTFKEI